MVGERINVRIKENIQLTEGVFSLWLETEEIANYIKPGQFVSLFCNDGGHLLPRPISICEVNQEEGMIRLVYRVVGKGTKEFSLLKAGENMDIMGPLGNGFMNIEDVREDSRSILVGGGVGIPPLLELAKKLPGEKHIILGYRDNGLFLALDFKKYGNVYIATEDGSVGSKGNVMDAIREQNITGNMIYSCGPKPMLNAVKEFANKNNIKAQLSLEERMACGVGACLACVCETPTVDNHSNVNNKRVCKDGPVFWSDEVEL